MELNIGVLLTTLFMVFIMEMGDKTQLLVMCLSSKYKPIKVFWGIALASLLLNFLAVILGAAIGGIKVIQDCVRAAASILFIFFGILSFRYEEEENGDCGNGARGVILTVALAFFLAEFGDKTQLSTFSFAALYPDNPVSVFMGSTIGLVASDCLGLIAGSIVVKYIPKPTISYVSAVLFILFGLMNGWNTLRYHFVLDMRSCVIITAITALVSVIASLLVIISNRKRIH